jgi:hypothetical protein
MGMTSEDLVRQNFERHSGVKKGATEMPMLNEQPLPPAKPDSLDNLLALFADPAAVKKAKAELAEAKSALDKRIAEAANADKVLAELDKELADKRAAHDGILAQDRERHDAEWAQRHTALTARERRIEEREAETERLHAAAVALKSSWENRTKALKQAIGA